MKKNTITRVKEKFSRIALPLIYDNEDSSVYFFGDGEEWVRDSFNSMREYEKSILEVLSSINKGVQIKHLVIYEGKGFEEVLGVEGYDKSRTNMYWFYNFCDDKGIDLNSSSFTSQLKEYFEGTEFGDLFAEIEALELHKNIK